MTIVRHLPLLFLGLIVAGCGSSSSDTTSPTASNRPALASSTASLTPQEVAAQADVPLYPGAKFPDSATKPSTKDDAGKTHTYLVMTTTDAPAKVSAYYQKSGGHYSELKTKDGIEVQGMSPKGDLVLIDLTSSGGTTTISVKSVQGS